MSRSTFDSVEPQPQERQRIAGEALPPIREYLAADPHDRLRVTVHDDTSTGELVLPREAVELLAAILAHISAGRGVAVVPRDAELTTQQAAELLNVSRPFLIGLLEAGEIEYRKVGKHRRIRADSIWEYKQQDDKSRRDAADELTQLGQDMGLI